jgi:hypothetical protein
MGYPLELSAEAGAGEAANVRLDPALPLGRYPQLRGDLVGGPGRRSSTEGDASAARVLVVEALCGSGRVIAPSPLGVSRD